MTNGKDKVLQYLDEAHAHERALVSVLSSQIAMTPRGSYRTALETHLRETRNHADRVGRRRKALGGGRGPLASVVGLAETVVGQALALSKTPLDMVRGSGGEEKILKNAKDACATEALEIATYTALERVARVVGDKETADLAASIRADEEKMLDRVTRELPKLADAVVRADVKGDHSFDVTKTGAADATRAAGQKAASKARKTTKTAKRQSRQARKVPGVARAEGAAKGAVATEGDLAIAGYDALNGNEISDRLPSLSQIELAKVQAYERKNENRTTILERISSLQGDEPWAGYDELSVSEIVAVIGEGDEERITKARSYERAHKNRAGVLEATERQTSNA
jgi:ferritin-like metal-binding protein YciE